MKFRTVAATSVLAIAALGVVTGTAHAAPAPAPAPVIPSFLEGVDQGIAQVLPSIGWKTALEGDSVVVETDAGSLTTADNQLQVRDDQGNVVVGFPLSYTLNDLEYPIAASVDGLRAVLTPNTDPASARPSSLLRDVVRQDAFDDAVSAAATQFGIVTAIGTLVGTLVGGFGGCAIGAVGGLVLGIPVLALGGATGIAGCLAGAAVGIPLGAAAGLVLTGVPAAIAIGIGFHNRINAPENQ
ncbi:hypothetical protein IU433_30245 [Nocardia puris]|uniref:DUF8020 domain-containing protein n=1 Tax=Nocardia puris TaxID=208602 RepID=A0A366E4F4_9NOCA|nr:hypothetical protein [Nocardia puris]MBF6215475.1 hypothetical protein [Nocardia puris]MBF6369085.1 hypothetical protein [Nocardia puris]MBF6463286.1 hypothetical protein [Nocardia puris]RBO96679.1 hypothetical protein DFR74_101695 [Nocardia puris]